MIKSCPFCGSEAKLITCAESCDVGGVVVECRKCRASGPVVFGCMEDPNEHAIAVWNRRTTKRSMPRFTEEQKVAFVKAIFDNDHSLMENLKAAGRRLKPTAESDSTSGTTQRNPKSGTLKGCPTSSDSKTGK